MAIQYNCNFDGTMPFSDVCKYFDLAANAEDTFTIPGDATNKYQALFSFNATANLFVRLNGTVTIPASGTSGTDQYTDFRPEKRYVQGGDVLHLKTTDASLYVNVSLRQLPG